MYGEPDTELVVPVGEDQISHVEMSREIVRKFNFHMGLKIELQRAKANQDNFALSLIKDGLDRAMGIPDSARDGSQVPTDFDIREMESKIRRLASSSGLKNLDEQFGAFENRFQDFVGMHAAFEKYVSFERTLVEPAVKLTQTPRIPGTDGRKMSKSYGNFISLSECDDSIRTKSRAMITDPARKRRTDPGNPDVCPVYDWHKLFSSPEILKWSAEGCRSAGIGCIECKTAMADNLIKWIEPVRARREEYAAHPDNVLRILDEGSTKAREVAQKTMGRVREAIFGWEKKRSELVPQRLVGKD
jgi:tryptophanyl-tRNA synthetase